MTEAPKQFSIIIPFYNEASSLIPSLQLLCNSFPESEAAGIEIILCNGGSNDNSVALIQQFPITIIHSKRGRALQMNAGAQKASGEWLIFLHADTHLPPNWSALIAKQKQNWGRFDVHLSGRPWIFRIIEFMMNFRSCTTGIATGDQAMFFRRSFFFKLGGFPSIPLMEDIAISKLARKHSSPACIHQYVNTSSRRWEQHGVFRTIFLMWFLRLAYWMGVHPSRLHQWYYPNHSSKN